AAFEAPYALVREFIALPAALTARLRSAVETDYRPLHGELDIHRMETRLRESVAAWEAKRPPLQGQRRHAIDRVIDYLAREHPRLLDRTTLLRTILRVSASLEIYGPGWSKHPEFSAFHKLMLQTKA